MKICETCSHSAMNWSFRTKAEKPIRLQNVHRILTDKGEMPRSNAHAASLPRYNPPQSTQTHISKILPYPILCGAAVAYSALYLDKRWSWEPTRSKLGKENVHVAHQLTFLRLWAKRHNLVEIRGSVVVETQRMSSHPCIPASGGEQGKPHRREP